MKYREIKIKVGKKSAEVQKALFEKGCTNLGYPKSRYIFVNRNGVVMGSDDREMFNDSAFKEVSADKILGIKKPKKLKKGMPVLVRDNDKQLWSIDVFTGTINDGREYPFIGHRVRWGQCIPYKGNEHLLGTTDKEGATK